MALMERAVLSMYSADAQQPVFRLAQISDIHLSLGRDANHSRRKFDAVLDELQHGRYAPKPELLIVAGDLALNPQCAGLAGEENDVAGAIGQVARQLKALDGVGVLAVPGNHDLGATDAACERAWRENFGAADFNFALEHRGVLLILLDNSAADAAPAPRLDERNRWLERLLRENPAQPKIVVTHVPLVPLRDPDVLRESFGADNWMNLDPRHALRGILERHRESILAVLCGHLHLSGHCRFNGIDYFCASGLESWPCDYLYLDFYRDRLEVRLLSAGPEVRRLGAAGTLLGNGIHDRYGEQRVFRDSRHDSFEEYLTGGPAERRVEIPLARKTPWCVRETILARGANGLPAPNTRCVRLNPMEVLVENLGAAPLRAELPLEPPPARPFHVTIPQRREYLLTVAGTPLWQPVGPATLLPFELAGHEKLTLRLSCDPPPADWSAVPTSASGR